MKKSKLIIINITIIIVHLFYSCKDKTPSPSAPPVNETELITTVKLIFTDTANNMKQTFKFYDNDGIGGNPPSILDTIDLKSNRVYQTQILLLDETKNPIDSVSNEVLNKGADHLFVFTKSGVNIAFNITDRDKNSLPIGLSSYWSTEGSSYGTVTVVLRHQPGVKDGTAAPGLTDIQVAFPCRIK